MEHGEAGDACGKVRLGDDRVPAIDALGPVARQLHRHRARHAGPLEVPHGRPPEVVHEATLEPGRGARARPRTPIGANGYALAVEHVRDHPTCRARHSRGPFALRDEERGESGQSAEREHAPLVILRGAGLETNNAGGEVDLAPREREHFADPPARQVGELHRWLKV